MRDAYFSGRQAENVQQESFNKQTEFWQLGVNKQKNADAKSERHRIQITDHNPKQTV